MDKVTYFCVLDFEASCWQSGNRGNMEVIEFPSVLGRLEGSTLINVAEFQQYVRPVIVPELSQFCTELTGIRQEQVDNATPFPDVYAAHYEWLKSHVGPSDSVIMVTCGGWDLKTMLPMEYARYPDLPKQCATACSFSTFAALALSIGKAL
jgi:inhibitor of KinA sporulation pathway (predicted exonuclease)